MSVINNKGQDKLSEFLEIALENTSISLANIKWKSYYERLRDINAIFYCVFKDWVNLPHVLPSIFLMHSHASYLGAARLSLSAQLPEAYMVMRGCLESSMYGCYLVDDPSKVQIYLQRDKDDASKKAFRTLFAKTRLMYDAIKNHSEPMSHIIEELYDETITSGAHPNPEAVLGSLQMNENEIGPKIDKGYFNDDHDALKICLLDNAQVGIAVLKVFSLVFSERFTEVGAIKRIDELSQGL